MRPGSRVVSGRSMTCAPGAAFSGPTLKMWFPWTTTTHPVCTGSPSVHTRAGRRTTGPAGSAARPKAGNAAATATTHSANDFNKRTSGAHQHCRIVALEALDGTAVGVIDEALGDFVGAGGKQHPQDDIVGRAGGLLGQQLLDDAGETVRELVDEPQVRGVMHLFPPGTVGGTSL